MEGTSRTIALKCASCGAGLDIRPDMSQFACGYCGTNQVVERVGGTVSLKLLGDAIARVQASTDRTAAELAVRRLRDDLAVIQRQLDDVTRQRSAVIEQRNMQIRIEATRRVQSFRQTIKVLATSGLIFASMVFVGSCSMGIGAGNPEDGSWAPWAFLSILVVLLGWPLLLGLHHSFVAAWSSREQACPDERDGDFQKFYAGAQERMGALTAEIQQHLAKINVSP